MTLHRTLVTVARSSGMDAHGCHVPKPLSHGSTTRKDSVSRLFRTAAACGDAVSFFLQANNEMHSAMRTNVHRDGPSEKFRNAISARGAVFTE